MVVKSSDDDWMWGLVSDATVFATGGYAVSSIGGLDGYDSCTVVCTWRGGLVTASMAKPIRLADTATLPEVALSVSTRRPLCICNARLKWRRKRAIQAAQEVEHADAPFGRDESCSRPEMTSQPPQDTKRA
nr:hypothetical protein CFP56_57843 [Quercus suber]